MHSVAPQLTAMTSRIKRHAQHFAGRAEECGGIQKEGLLLMCAGEALAHHCRECGLSF